ncbi:MAG: DinB family protein [bacterium]
MTSTAVLEVIDELDRHRTQFEEFCRSLSQEELDRPVPKSTWVVRDFIAHLATIDGPVSEMFKSMHAGEDAGIRDADGGKFDIDDWNDKQVERRRVLSVDDVLAEAAKSRAELKSHMLVLTDEDLARTLKFGGDSKRAASEIPFGGYLRGWCKHDPMHAMDMSRALPERQAALAPWFDDPIIQMYQKSMNS